MKIYLSDYAIIGAIIYLVIGLSIPEKFIGVGFLIGAIGMSSVALWLNKTKKTKL